MVFRLGTKGGVISPVYMYNKGKLTPANGKAIDNNVIGTFISNGLTSEKIRYQPECIVFDELGGDIEDRLKKTVAALHRLGCGLCGTIKCFGDYEGAYEVHEDGTVESFWDERWAVHKAETEHLIGELTRRGYAVKKNP